MCLAPPHSNPNWVGSELGVGPWLAAFLVGRNHRPRRPLENNGYWVSTSLLYPLHLVSEAAMTAD